MKEKFEQKVAKETKMFRNSISDGFIRTVLLHRPLSGTDPPLP
jgi:hypothetical protein